MYVCNTIKNDIIKKFQRWCNWIPWSSSPVVNHWIKECVAVAVLVTVLGRESRWNPRWGHSPGWWYSHVLLYAGPSRLFFSSSVVLDQPHRLLPNLHGGRGPGHVLQSRSFCHHFSLQLWFSQSYLQVSSCLSNVASFTAFAWYLIDNILLFQLESLWSVSGRGYHGTWTLSSRQCLRRFFGSIQRCSLGKGGWVFWVSLSHSQYWLFQNPFLFVWWFVVPFFDRG